jgi:hypothetical protein
MFGKLLENFKDTKTPGYLLGVAATHPATAAEYERIFDVNYIATKKHNCLMTVRISDLLFMKLNGPPQAKFKPQAFVMIWLQLGPSSFFQCAFINHSYVNDIGINCIYKYTCL